MGKEENPSSWPALVQYILERLPGWIALFSLGYRAGNRKAQNLEVKLSETELELEKKTNEEKLNSSLRDKSDADILRDSIRPRRDQK